jgi:hypothetical protein
MNSSQPLKKIFIFLLDKSNFLWYNKIIKRKENKKMILSLILIFVLLILDIYFLIETIKIIKEMRK